MGVAGGAGSLVISKSARATNKLQFDINKTPAVYVARIIYGIGTLGKSLYGNLFIPSP